MLFYFRGLGLARLVQVSEQAVEKRPGDSYKECRTQLGDGYREDIGVSIGLKARGLGAVV